MAEEPVRLGGVSHVLVVVDGLEVAPLVSRALHRLEPLRVGPLCRTRRHKIHSRAGADPALALQGGQLCHWP